MGNAQCAAIDLDGFLNPSAAIEEDEKHVLLFYKLSGLGLDALSNATESFPISHIKTFPSDLNATQAMIFFSSESDCEEVFKVFKGHAKCRVLKPEEIENEEKTFLKAEVETLTTDIENLEERIMKYDVIQNHKKKKFKPTFAQIKTTSEMFMLIDHNDDCSVSLEEFRELCRACNIHGMTQTHQDVLFEKISLGKEKFHVTDLERVVGHRCRVADFKDWIYTEIQNYGMTESPTDSIDRKTAISNSVGFFEATQSGGPFE